MLDPCIKRKGWDIDTDATTVEEAKEAILKALKLPLKKTVSEDRSRKGGGFMIRDITIGQYYPAESVIHRLDPRVKLVGTLTFIISLFLHRSFLMYLVAAVFLTIVIKASKVPFLYDKKV